MRFNPTERIGVNAVERIVIEELQWIFREQPLVDVGIDALIEVVDNGLPSCKFIASQIKSGKGNFYEKDKSWTYYASDIHYNYWTNSNVHVILIAYIPEERSAYWIHVESRNFIKNKRQWKIDIPKKQKLSAKSQNRLLALVGDYITVIEEENWSIERIQELNEQVKNIHESALLINELTEHFVSLHLENNIANEKYQALIDRGVTLESHQNKIVTKELTNAYRSVVPKIENCIHNFSKLFAIGFGAFQDIISGCLQFNLDPILDGILLEIEPFPAAAKEAVEQVEQVKQTLDKFGNYDKDLKQSTIALSEVLSLVIREFKVADNLTENIIKIIKEK